MNRRTLTIWAKEMVDAVHDRRTLLMMVVVPALLLPILAVVPAIFMGRQVSQQQEAPLRVVVDDGRYAPRLVAYLATAGVEVLPATQSLESALRQKEVSVALRIGPEFAERLEREQPAPLTVLSDDSRLGSRLAASRLHGLLLAYNQELAGQRLGVRGVDPVTIRPLQVRRESVATEQEQAATFTGIILPLLVLVYVVLGGMYTAIDVTAGEKERATLEPLLATPVSRWELVLGKWLAVLCTAVAAQVLLLAGIWLAFELTPRRLLGNAPLFDLPIAAAAGIALILIPLIAAVAGIEMAVCIFARNFKEAQNYIIPLQLVVMLSPLAVQFMSDLTPPLWIFAVPTLGHSFLIGEILAGKWLGSHLALVTASSAVYAALGLGLAISIFNRERVLFRLV